MKTLLTILILLITSPVFATDYYIKNGGNDGSAGTSDATAWANLDMIRQTGGNNNNFYLKVDDTWTSASEKAVYEEGVGGHGRLDSDGLIRFESNESTITVDAYYMDGGTETVGLGGNAKPILDMSAETDPTPDGLYPNYCCVRTNGGTSGIAIKNLSLIGGQDTSAIAFISSDGTNLVEGVDLTGVGLNNTTIETLALGKDSFVSFQSCSFDTEPSAINDYKYLYHIAFKQGGYGNVRDCTFTPILTNSVRSVHSSAVIGKTQTWERNYFYGADERNTTACKPMKIRSLDGGAASTDLYYVIRNNVIDYRDNDGQWSTDMSDILELATLHGGGGTEDERCPTTYFYNNTAISDGNGTFFRGHGDAVCETTYVFNNIAYNFDTFGAELDSLDHFRNNIYFSANIKFDGTPGTDSGNINADPNLNSVTFPNDLATDVELTVSSTDAIDGGFGTAGVAYIPDDDYSEGARDDGTVDIGAFEYGGASTTTTTAYYVSNAGDDGNAGTEGSPFASLYKVSIDATINDGDTIYLNRGDTWLVTRNRYTDPEAVGVGLWIRHDDVTVDAYGTGNDPIISAVNQSDNGNDESQSRFAPVVVGNIHGSPDTHPTDVTINNLVLIGPNNDGAAIMSYQAGAGLTVDGCTLSLWDNTCDGCGEGLMSAPTNNSFTVQNSTFDCQNSYKGIYIRNAGPDGYTIRNNVFKNIWSSATFNSIDESGTIVYEGNLVYDFQSGIALQSGFSLRESSGQTDGLTSNVIFRNNIIDMSGSTAGDLTAFNKWQPVDKVNWYMINNTIISDGDGSSEGVQCNDGTNHYEYIWNNIFYDLSAVINNGDQYDEVYNNIAYSCAYTWPGTVDAANNVTTNPNLSDPTNLDEASDAHLTGSSTNAIDSGYGTAGSGYIPGDDYNQAARDVGAGDLDIGAFELGSTPGSTSSTTTSVASTTTTTVTLSGLSITGVTIQ